MSQIEEYIKQRSEESEEFKIAYEEECRRLDAEDAEWEIRSKADQNY
ncbi:hypothetical protein [Bavariicoccus seileri]|nr:hypothetical protein [Bavariicoccus seileri]